MSGAKEYRRNATQCVVVAEDTISGSDRLILMQMAAAWLYLAKKAEKDSQANVSNRSHRRK